jgi:hypothetical protein
VAPDDDAASRRGIDRMLRPLHTRPISPQHREAFSKHTPSDLHKQQDKVCFCDDPLTVALCASDSLRGDRQLASTGVHLLGVACIVLAPCVRSVAFYDPGPDVRVMSTRESPRAQSPRGVHSSMSVLRSPAVDSAAIRTTRTKPEIRKCRKGSNKALPANARAGEAVHQVQGRDQQDAAPALPGWA